MPSADRPREGWDPKLETFQDGFDSRPILKGLGTGQLDGWPRCFHSAMAWSGEEFQSEKEYVCQLNEEDLKEIYATVLYFKGMSDNS
jgi:hypothetical protein